MFNQSDFSPEDIKLFLEETDEMLQGIEEGILRLEHFPDDAECLRALFRYAHTLKGSSATLGHQDMAKVAHRMESTLEGLRQGGVATRGLTDALLVGLDALRTFRNGIAGAATTPVDVPAVIALLEQVDPQAKPVPQASQTAAPAAAKTYPALNEAERAEAERTIIEEGGSAWWVTVAVDPAAPMRSVRAYQVIVELEQGGRVVRSWPTQDQLEQDDMPEKLQALVVTPQTVDELRAVLALIPETGPFEIEPAALAGQRQDPPQPAPAAPAPSGQASPPAQPGPSQSAPSQVAQPAPAGNRTVRVDVQILDTLLNLVGELVIDRTRLTQALTTLGDDPAAREVGQAAAHIGRVTADLQDQLMRARMLPMETLFRKFPRMVRDVANALNKQVELVVEGGETELDRAVIEEIADPILHLLRNGLDHGIEPPADRLAAGKPAQGTVYLSACHEEDRIVITIRDDGKGMDPVRIREVAVRKGVITQEAAQRLSDKDSLNLIFMPGFSTKEQVTDLSGRGVGMDVVKQNLDKLNGTVQISSEIGRGTEFRLKIPLTMAIMRGLLVEVLGETYVLPLSTVIEIVDLANYPTQSVRGQSVIIFRGQALPLVSAEEVFSQQTEDQGAGAGMAVLLQAGGRRMGLAVRGLVGEQEIVVKPLGKIVGDVPAISGATILGNGNVAPILDVGRLVDLMAVNR